MTEATPPVAPVPPPPDDRRGRVMFGLALVFLVLLAGLFHRHQRLDFHVVELQLLLTGLAVLWPVFVVEALWRFVRRDPRDGFWAPLGTALALSLVPPLRLGARSPFGERPLYVPFLGWRAVDADLCKELERFFSVPLIVLALMVLPLLGIEYGWAERVQQEAWLKLFLEVSEAVIWLAFAFEFVLMAAVARSRWRYCLEHWLELAIVLLPVIEFMPLLRVLRLGRLVQLNKMTRVYRLRGVVTKLWRAVLLLNLLQRLSGQTPQKRLARLEELLVVKEEELEGLRREIAELRQRIAEQARTRSEAAAPEKV